MSKLETAMLLEAQKKDTKHLLHFFITVLFFPWLIGWIIVASANRRHNEKIQHDIDDLTRLAVVEEAVKDE
jgi:hypothetical protein